MKNYLFASLIALALVACKTAQDVSHIKSHNLITLPVAFCAASQHHDLDAFLKLATPSLINVIKEAEAKNKIIAREYPDVKPPLSDGIPLQAYPDFAPICNGRYGIAGPGWNHLEIAHEFGTNIPPHYWGWIDHLEVVKTSEGMKINNILYAPHYHNNLRQVLSEAFTPTK